MSFQPPRGTRDKKPEEMIRYQYVLDIVRRIFEKYGFDPLDTPAFEEWALLSAKSGGGEEIKDEIYYFVDKSDRELGLRFDFTVPLARFVANNPDIPKPLRRYQIGPVWRYDRPGALRWREFIQADIDIVGSTSMEADADCIRCFCEIFSALGFRDFVIRINNRKIIEEVVRSINVENVTDVFRAIDKLEKTGEEEVKKELLENNIPEAKADIILGFIKKPLDEISLNNKEGVEEVKRIVALLNDYKDNVRIDLSLVRGLEYYTGPVFEVSVGADVSVGGGGRYDDLVKLYGGKDTPATGISIGVDRLVAVMREKEMFSLPKTMTKVFVVSVNDSIKQEARRVANELRNMDISSEYDLMSRSLSKQLDYVNARGIPFAIVIGEKEFQSRKAKLRNMESGKEQEVSLDDLSAVKGFIDF